TPPTLNDVVVAQQNLAQSVATYLTTLGGLWQAVVDLAGLLQTDDLFGMKTDEVADIPDLEKLFALPCCHRCSPPPWQHDRVLDGEWPSAMPPTPMAEPEKPTMLPSPRPARKE